MSASMTNSSAATRAYAASRALRGLREQEADVFHRVNAGLRRARDGSSLDRIRAFADNDLLWNTVIGCASDPLNALPDAIRANLVSIGRAVLNDMKRADPDVAFLVRVNEDVAAGLSGG